MLRFLAGLGRSWKAQSSEPDQPPEPETIVVNGETMKAPHPNCTANVRVGSSWRTMKRRTKEPLAEFVQRCEEAALAARDSQPEAASAAAPGKQTGGGDGRVLRKRAVSDVCSEQVEAPAVLCRWCQLPEAAHADANRCASRKYPAIPKPSERAAGSEADRDYHRRYTAASRELQRTADAELATAVDRGLPCPDLPATFAPGGPQHCGGDLVFPGLTLIGAEFGAKNPTFTMASGAVAVFRGRDLLHATLEHHPDPHKGCEAHVSFAVQTQAGTMRLASAAVAETHKELCDLGALDAVTQWKDAVWIPVSKGEQQTNEAAKTHLCHDCETMHSLQWKRVVLYDRGTGKPLVLYDVAGAAAAHFNLNSTLLAQPNSCHTSPNAPYRTRQVGWRRRTDRAPHANFRSSTSTISRSPGMRAVWDQTGQASSVWSCSACVSRAGTRATCRNTHGHGSAPTTQWATSMHTLCSTTSRSSSERKG